MPPPKDQNDDVDMNDPDCDKKRPRELFVEERETKMMKPNVLDDERNGESVETEVEWIHNEICFRRTESPQFATLMDDR